MSIQVKVSIKPTVAELKRRNEERHKQLSDLQSPHAMISVLLDQWVQRNFKSEGRLVGGWKELAAGGRWVGGVTGARFFDPTAKILRDTTRLQHSFLPFANKKVAGIGSDLDYSETHEKGLDGLPIRRMLPTRKEAEPIANRIYDEHIKRGLRKK